MPEARQLSARRTGVSWTALAALAAVFVAGLFVVAFDQGHLLSMVYGEQAFADQFFHELAHDVRHAAGFPCH